MNFATIVIITFIASVSFYIIFLVLGVGGIANNRNAQDLDHESKK
tara:strand:- start:104 stop:238 length:135 start_codon:yes stop_codon:yes gene_type:complete